MKLVVFDIDGTLTSTSGVDNAFLAQVLSKLVGGVEIDTNWENYPSFTDTGIADHCSQRYRQRALTPTEADQLEHDFMLLLRGVPTSSFQPVNGAREFFGTLAGSEQFAVAIATGSWRLSAIHKLTGADIPFQGVPLASCNDASRREDIMRTAEARAFDHYGRSAFDETIYFGDGVWDVRATGALNWRMVGIGENIDRLRELGCPTVFRDYRDPAAIFEAINA